MTMVILQVILLSIFVDICQCGTDNECGRNCFVDMRNIGTIICTDIIPNCIPDGTTGVSVDSTSNDPKIIMPSNFTGKNWNKVTHLGITHSSYGVFGGRVTWTLSATCFGALESLRELHIGIERMDIDPDSLVGLSELEVIDFTGCHSLNKNQLSSVLNGTNKMANLKKIVLSDWDTTGPSYDFDDKLVDVLLPRNITIIDLSKSHINVLNLTTIVECMNHLKSLNLSHSTMGRAFIKPSVPFDEDAQVDILDLSYFKPPHEVSILPQRYRLVDVTYHEPYPDPTGYLHFLSTFLKINFTSIIQSPTSIWLENIQISLGQKLHLHMKEVELKENNINRLDLKFGDNVTLDFEYLGLSNNDLEFLHSSILSRMANLTRLDLSRNRMYIMYEEDPQEFEQLLCGVPALRYIHLSHNNLTHIPADFFQSSSNLSNIDLSYNRLTQFTFHVSGLINLRVIDMRSNNIKILDSSSLHNLHIFQSNENSHVETSCDILLSSNPISCSVCTAKPFLEWILSTRLVDIKSQGLNCIDEQGNQIAINVKAVSAAHFICIRMTVIISVMLTATIVLTSVTALFVWLNKRRTRENILAHRRVIIERMREGEGPYEFPVFLSYSSKDDSFAQDNILPHLNDNLQIVTGIYTDRNLVCTGDANLRPGFYVHDEIDFCLDKSSAVIILVTEDYCMSDYCGSELEKSYMKKKPVVLMFKEHVNEGLMSRTMRELYKRNVRILWAEQNGQYVLQTTWENVCTSIIDLIE